MILGQAGGRGGWLEAAAWVPGVLKPPHPLPPLEPEPEPHSSGPAHRLAGLEHSYLPWLQRGGSLRCSIAGRGEQGRWGGGWVLGRVPGADRPGLQACGSPTPVHVAAHETPRAGPDALPARPGAHAPQRHVLRGWKALAQDELWGLHRLYGECQAGGGAAGGGRGAGAGVLRSVCLRRLPGPAVCVRVLRRFLSDARHDS